ncbi:MAG: thiopurine S-methyltransferase [Gammaproteobacteria bacterium]
MATDSTNSFWIKRWQDGDIGWHHQEINPHLLSHWSRLDIPSGSTLFVPLCGKSLDMVWLAQQGFSVVGVEISQKAVEEFFAERSLVPERTKSAAFDIFQANVYRLLCGDIFRLEPEHIQGVRAVYDRASLVALNQKQRRHYADLMTTMLPSGCSMLLVAMDYPETEMQGPPYSVPESEVVELFGDGFSIAKLHSLNLLQDTERYTGKGLSRLSEHIYKLERKESTRLRV